MDNATGLKILKTMKVCVHRVIMSLLYVYMRTLNIYESVYINVYKRFIISMSIFLTFKLIKDLLKQNAGFHPQVVGF